MQSEDFFFFLFFTLGNTWGKHQSICSDACKKISICVNSSLIIQILCDDATNTSVEDAALVDVWIILSTPFSKASRQLATISPRLWTLRTKPQLETRNIIVMAYNNAIRQIIECTTIVWDPYTLNRINKQVQKNDSQVYNSSAAGDEPPHKCLNSCKWDLSWGGGEAVTLGILFVMSHIQLKIDGNKYIACTRHRSRRLDHGRNNYPHSSHLDVSKSSFFAIAVVYGTA